MASRSLPYSLFYELHRAIRSAFDFLALIREIFDEMQEMRRAAHAQHPFMEM
jgi:hypothetical protein